MAPRHDPIPDLILEQYVLGELNPMEMEALEESIAADPELSARVAAIHASNREILTAFPPEAFARDVARRLRASDPRPNRSWQRPARWMVLSPALAAAAILLILLVRPLYYGTPTVTPELRTKGLETHLRIYRQAGEEAELLAADARVSAGDLLQLSYVAAGAPYGVILSIDGRGEVTLHHPGERGQSTHLAQRGETLLPHAYQLDDAPLFERFFVVTGNRPIEVETVLSAARTLAANLHAAREAPLALPGDLQQHSITLGKTEVGP